MLIYSAHAAPPITDEALREAIADWSVQDIYAMFDAASQWMLVFGVIAAVIAFIAGGWMLFMSRGNEEQVSKGKKTFFWAATGLVIIVVARALVLIIGNFFEGA